MINVSLFPRKGVCGLYPASQTISMGILIGPVECPVATETIEMSCSGHCRGQDLKLTVAWLRGCRIIYIRKRCGSLDVDCWVLTSLPTASPSPACRTFASSKNNLAHPEEKVAILEKIIKLGSVPKDVSQTSGAHRTESCVLWVEVLLPSLTMSSWLGVTHWRTANRLRCSGRQNITRKKDPLKEKKKFLMNSRARHQKFWTLLPFV